MPKCQKYLAIGGTGPRVIDTIVRTGRGEAASPAKLSMNHNPSEVRR